MSHRVPGSDRQQASPSASGAAVDEATPPASGASGAERRFDVLVVGAGVVGVATAYALARRGLSVAIVDRAEGPARGSSFANGAQLSYAYSDALGSPALVRKLPSLVLGADPLFKVRLGLDPAMIGWGLRFLARSTASGNRAGTLETLRLALESQAAMHALLERHHIDFGHEAAGKMHLYFDRQALAAGAEMSRLKQAHGVEQAVLAPREAVDLEPAVADADGLVGAIYSPGDEVGDPHRFTAGLLGVLTREHGVRAIFGVDARPSLGDRGVALALPSGERIEASTLVCAAGADAARFLKAYGVRAPVLAMKGYSFTAPPGDSAPAVSLTHTARKIVFCRLSGRMRVAGIAELGAADARLDEARLADLIETARAALPGAAAYDAAAEGWSGLRPMSPSSVPIIARPRPRLVVNIGHGMLGWTLAMGSAERAAGLVVDALQTIPKDQ